MEESRESRRGDYVTVKLPRELAEYIDIIIRSRRYGYRSRAEFVAEAVREKLRQLGFFKPK